MGDVLGEELVAFQLIHIIMFFSLARLLCVEWCLVNKEHLSMIHKCKSTSTTKNTSVVLRPQVEACCTNCRI